MEGRRDEEGRTEGSASVSGGSSFQHTSVLLGPVVDLMNVRPGGVYVDGTLGGGGYAKGVLGAAEGVFVIGIDRDPAALKVATSRLEPIAKANGGRFKAVHGSFGNLEAHLDALGLEKIDGVMLDLGVSSHQLDVAERGFSFMRDGPLDMRMNPTTGPTAADVVANKTADELASILRDFGEERHAKLVARAVVRAREKEPITRTLALATIVERGLGRRGRPKRGAKGIHPATRSFQALRIAVNGELDQLQMVLPASVARLKAGGRVAVVSFHSLEDRIVKRFFRQQANPCTCPPDLPVCACGLQPTLTVKTRRAVVAEAVEVEANARSRSARLRVAERLADDS